MFEHVKFIASDVIVKKVGFTTVTKVSDKKKKLHPDVLNVTFYVSLSYRLFNR